MPLEVGSQNKAFLDAIDGRTRSEILKAIAKHYDITEAQALDEVTDPEAENLLDYLTEPIRSATNVLMKRKGMR